MKKNLLLLISFCAGIFHTYSQSINYLHTTNGAMIPTGTPAINYFGPDSYGNYGSCGNGGWEWIDALCSDATINSPDSSVKHFSQGSTWGIGDSTARYMVVDLGVARTFNELRVFQMFSDGRVTHAAMYAFPDTTGGIDPIYSNADWELVLAESLVNGGVQNDSVVTDPSAFTFPETTARYVKFEFRNDGRYDIYPYNFVEVREIKLFNNSLTGINHNDNKGKISIYPNPTKGQVNINFPESNKQYNIEIYSLVGKLVKRLSNQTNNKTSFDLTGNTKGLYFVKIMEGEHTILVDKLFIQ